MNIDIKISKYWGFIFWICLLLILFLSLMPTVPHMPTTGWDKTNHLVTFAFLSVLGRKAYPERHAALFLGLLFYGGLIELLQFFTPSHFAEWEDWAADGLGLVIGGRLEGLFYRSGRASYSE